MAKLTPDEVLEIRYAMDEGHDIEEIAKVYDLSIEHVRGIDERLFWADVLPPTSDEELALIADRYDERCFWSGD